MATADQVWLYPAGEDQEPVSFPSTVVTPEWLQQQLCQSQKLEAVPCEEDHLTDEEYEALFYLIVDAHGYTRDLPRNTLVERTLRETVAIHTRCPSERNSHAFVGLFGPAILVPKALVPREALPRW